MSLDAVVFLLVEVIAAVFVINVFFPPEHSRVNSLLKTALFISVIIQLMYGIGVLTGVAVPLW